MRFLVDANVLSEATKPRPEPAVVDWLRAHERDLAVDPVVLGELRFGILLVRPGARRKRLESWFEQGAARIECLPWDRETALTWAELLARLRRAGRSMPVKDSLIAATALTYGLTIATRDTGHFTASGVDLIDPFDRAKRAGDV